MASQSGRDGARWFVDDAGNKIVHHGNYRKMDDKGQSIALCGARSYISEIDGIVMSSIATQVTCQRCIGLMEKMVDRAIARDSHGYKP